MALRIVFLGTPDFATPSLRSLWHSEHDVLAVITQPDRPRGRGQKMAAPPVKAFAATHGLPVFQPDRLKAEAFMDAIRALRPDLGVVAAYGKLLPQALLDLPRLGMINVHASLLPRWRGAAPVHRAIMAGDETTGITIMKVVKALDAGPMLARSTLAIRPDETGGELERRLGAMGARLLLEVVDRMAVGPMHLEPQDDEAATYASKITRGDSPIDWSQLALAIHNHIRALQPWPQASTWIGGKRLLIRRAAVDDTAAAQPPGTVEVADGDDFIVAAADRRVRILEIQPEGRPAMPARAFLNGHRVPPGTQLTAQA